VELIAIAVELEASAHEHPDHGERHLYELRANQEVGSLYVHTMPFCPGAYSGHRDQTNRVIVIAHSGAS